MMKKRILVCDDDKGILEVMEIMLQTKGWEVKALSDGKGIIKKIQEFKPDLIFLDIWMPGINGKEIVLLLKKDSTTKNIPIIIVSALSDTEAIAKKAGANGHLGKPFEMNELFSIVEQYAN